MILVIAKSFEESPALAAWASLFARAQSPDKPAVHVVHLPAVPQADSDQQPDLSKSLHSSLGDVLADIEFTAESKDENNRIKAALREVAKTKPELLIIARPNSKKGRRSDHLLAQRLFESAPCHTMLVRLGESPPPKHPHILIPTAGGPHSQIALQLAARISNEDRGDATPFYVEPDIGEVSEDVGRRLLDSVLKRAGIKLGDSPNIHPRIVIADGVPEGVKHLVDSHSFDLVLIGAPAQGFIQKRIFGSVPERLFKGPDSMNVAVLRRALPVKERVRGYIERFLHLRVPQLKRDDRVALFEELQTKSRWSFDFMTLLLLSTAIASFGLLQNSTAVVIGAMLVAPLMTPLLGAGLALVQGNIPMVRQCLRSIIYGFLGAVTIGLIAGLIVPITDLTTELLARGAPSLLDMAIAFLSGIAAAYCIARPSLMSALAGVAIAAALVPPRATTGISLALGHIKNTEGAALLFATNVVAIILGAALCFFAVGIRPATQQSRGTLWTRRITMGLVLTCAILVVPLGSVLLSQVIKSRQSPEVPPKAAAAIAAALKEKNPNIELTDLRLTRPRDAPPILDIHLDSPEIPQPSLANHLRKVTQPLLKHNSDTLKVRLHTTLLTESQAPSSNP
ncbi:MAG: DUF389 domain-containing protein [Verrucomicrobiota bacterium]